MALYAIDRIDDAVELTREFLLPFSWGRWLRLALIVFFVGGLGGGFNFPGSFGGGFPSGGPTADGPGPGPGPEPLAPGEVAPELTDDVLAAIALVVLAVLLIAVAFSILGAIMEFVLVESLRSGRVTVRRYVGRRWGQGLRLFGFRLVVGLLGLAAVVAVGAVLFLPALADPTGAAVVGAVLALLPVLFLLAVVLGVVSGFTTMFVVPVMVAEDCGVLAGWRRLWSTMRGQWKQYLAYLVVGFFLTLVGGIAGGIAIGLAAVGLLVVFGLLVALALFVLGPITALTLAGWVVLGLLALLFVLAMVVVGTLIMVPIQSYLRYHALLVLGDSDADLDLVADRRPAVE